MAKLVFKENVKVTIEERATIKRDVCLIITGEQLLDNKDSDPK
jgi:hypothetical protein